MLRLKTFEKKTSKRISPYEIIETFVDNMNSLSTAKYKLVSNDIERRTLKSEADGERFNFSRLEKISREKIRLEKFDKKIHQRNKLKLRSLLEVGEEVLILAAQLRKKDSPGKFYKSSVNNKCHFHKEETFLITNRGKNHEKFFYWLKS